MNLWMIVGILAVAGLAGAIWYWFRTKNNEELEDFSTNDYGDESSSDSDALTQVFAKKKADDMRPRVEKKLKDQVQKKVVERCVEKGVPQEKTFQANEAMGKIVETVRNGIRMHYELQDDEVEIDDEVREYLEAASKGSSVSPFAAYALAINTKGQLRLPLDDLDFITGTFDPIVLPGGTMRVTNMLKVEEAILLAIKMRTPIYYYDDEQKKMERLSAELASRLVASPDKLALLERADASEAQRKKLNQDLVELNDHIQSLNSEIKSLTTRNGKLSEQLSSKEDEILILKQQLKGSKKMASAPASDDRSASADEASAASPTVENFVPSEHVEYADASMHSDPEQAVESNRHEAPPTPPVQVSSDTIKKTVDKHGSSTSPAPEPPMPKNTEAPEQPTGGERAKLSSLARWIKEDDSGNSLQNYKTFGLIANKGGKMSTFDATRLMAYGTKKAKSLGLLPAIINRTSERYVIGSNGTSYRVEAADIFVRGLAETEFETPREISFFEKKVENTAFDVDESKKDRYRKLLSDVNSYKTELLDAENIRFTVTESEWI